MIDDPPSQYRGRFVDAPGDNLLAEFASVVDAVQCAVAIQTDTQEAKQRVCQPDARWSFVLGSIWGMCWSRASGSTGTE